MRLQCDSSAARPGLNSVVSMKILVSSGPSFGLYFPVVPLAWALRAAGHEVLVASPESMAATVNGSGLPHVATYGPMHMREVMLHDRAGTPLAQADTEEGLLEQVGRGFGRLAARTLDGMLAITEAWRPDAIIGEAHAFSAGVAAKIHGIPWFENGIGIGYRSDIDGWTAVELAPELERLGFDALPEPDVVLDTCPAIIRPEDVVAGQPMRCVQYDTPAPVPSWVFEKRDRPRIMITLGTILPNSPAGPAIFNELVRTLPSLGVELVLAMPDEAVAKLAPLPDAVVAAGWMPLTSVLPACDLTVHHAGGGSTMSSLIAGLPQLLAPGVMAEQRDSAQRLCEFGAAKQLQSQEVEPAEVLEACRALLEDASYRDRASQLKQAIEEMPSPGAVVPVIEDFVRHSAVGAAEETE